VLPTSRLPPIKIISGGGFIPELIYKLPKEGGELCGCLMKAK
jgi:hypothetical protein